MPNIQHFSLIRFCSSSAIFSSYSERTDTAATRLTHDWRQKVCFQTSSSTCNCERPVVWTEIQTLFNYVRDPQWHKPPLHLVLSEAHCSNCKLSKLNLVLTSVLTSGTNMDIFLIKKLVVAKYLHPICCCVANWAKLACQFDF